MKIFKEKPGIISDKSIWVCLCGHYMYTADSLEDLITILNTEWELDKHIIG